MATGIRKAVVANDVEALNKILSGDELVDTSCYDNVCIKWAISNGYYEIVRLLLAYGLTKKLTHEEIKHNVNIAICNHHDETVEYVLNYYSLVKENRYL